MNKANPNNSLMIVSYLFPPTGGAGVQRNLKYSKFLTQFGWSVSVLSVKSILYHAYDEKLCLQIPENVRVIRTESLDPLRLAFLFFKGIRKFKRIENNSKKALKPVKIDKKILNRYRNFRDFFVFPDIQLLWIPFSVFSGVLYVKKYNVKFVMGSIGPVSNALSAFLISIFCNISLIIDFRDGWVDDPYVMKPASIYNKLHENLERIVISHSKKICVYGVTLKDQLLLRYPDIEDKVHVLPNGFDKDDLENVPHIAKGEFKKQLLYSGTIHKDIHYNNLHSFLEAMSLLPSNLLTTFEVFFVGNVFDDAIEIVNKFKLQDNIIFLGYRSHEEALSFLKSADALLLFLKKDDFSSVSGKIFEYLMVNLPILACVESQGPCGQLLQEVHRDDFLAKPEDTQDIFNKLYNLLTSDWIKYDDALINVYDRKIISQKLIEVLNEIMV